MSENHFVRVPSLLLDSLLKLPLSGTQWRILLWTIRNTFGWDRETVRFSWYGIARELRLDRGGVVRAGRRLLDASVLLIQDQRLSLQSDPAKWSKAATSDDGSQRAMTIDIADASHRKRGRASSLFRRAIERCTEMKKESIRSNQKHHSAGAARPVAGKYDHISEA